MNKPITITEYKWSSTEFPICELGISAAELAGTLNIPIHSWQEDGLGQSSGFMCRLPSGLALLVQELEHSRTHLGSREATVLADAIDLAARDPLEIVNEIVASFGLTSNQVTWVQSEAGVQAARKFIDSKLNL